MVFGKRILAPRAQRKRGERGARDESETLLYEKAALALLQEQVVTVGGEEMVLVVTVTSRLVKKSELSSKGVGDHERDEVRYLQNGRRRRREKKSYEKPANEVATTAPAAPALAREEEKQGRQVSRL